MQLATTEIHARLYNAVDFTSCEKTPNNEAVKNTYTYRLMFLESGACRLEMNGKISVFSKGELLFLRPGDSYRIYNSFGDFHVINMYFHFTDRNIAVPIHLLHVFGQAYRPELCQELVKFTDADIFQFSVKLSARAEYERMVSDIFNTWNSYSRLSKLRASALLNALLLSIADHHADSPHNAAYEILSYIDKHDTEPLTAALLASKFGYHPYYIGKLLSDTTGMSLRQYIGKVKISHACELLRETDMTVTELSQYLSFTDSSHFTKVFRKYIGMTPTEYRCQ